MVSTPGRSQFLAFPGMWRESQSLVQRALPPSRQVPPATSVAEFCAHPKSFFYVSADMATDVIVDVSYDGTSCCREHAVRGSNALLRWYSAIGVVCAPHVRTQKMLLVHALHDCFPGPSAHFNRLYVTNGGFHSARERGGKATLSSAHIFVPGADAVSFATF